MKKIDERIDLSKQVLDINIKSPIFENMLNELDSEIQRCIKKVYDKDFEAGEISLKLTLAMPEAFKVFPKTDHDGELIDETYTYRQPRFEHKITTTLKKTYKQDGLYEDEREVKEDDEGNFIAIPIEDAQINMDDLVENI